MTATLSLTDLHTLPMEINTSAAVANYPASVYTAVLGQNCAPDALNVSITGKPTSQTGGENPGGLASTSLFIPNNLNTGLPCTKAVYSVTFYFTSIAALQAQEFGFKITDATGNTKPAVFQLDNSQKPGQTAITIVPASGNNGWVPIPASFVPALQPGTYHTITETASWTPTAVTISQFTLDGLVIPVPAAMATIQGKALGWGKNQFSLSIQSNTNAQGGSLSTIITDLGFLSLS
jgi:hypothetical protein